jgi:hypothetical protein
MLGLRQLRQWSVERLEHVRIDGVSGLADTPALAIDAIGVALYQTPSATTLFDNVPNDNGRERSSYCRWFTGPKKRVRRLRAHCGSVRGHSYSATDDDIRFVARRRFVRSRSTCGSSYSMPSGEALNRAEFRCLTRCYLSSARDLCQFFNASGPRPAHEAHVSCQRGVG